MSSIVTFIVTEKSDAAEPLRPGNMVILAKTLDRIVPECTSRYSPVAKGDTTQWSFGIEFDNFMMPERWSEILDYARQEAELEHLCFQGITARHAPLELTGP